MTPNDIQLLRSSWPLVAARTAELTTGFYSRLFEIDESAARLFAGVDMVSQRVKLGQALAIVVHALDDVDRLLPALSAMARRHAHYGVEDRHFESVGDALLWSLSDVLGDAFTFETRAAWAQAFAIVASVMRRALVRDDLAAAS